ISIINVESEPSTIFVNVERSSFAHININEGWGTLFASNSNGTYFHRVLENTHRNVFGVVGVEPIRGLDGVWIANQVMNTDSMGKPGVNALVRTVMSWDGGRTWHVLRAPTKDAEGRDLECKDCTLNLHDRIDAGLSGHVFGVPTAPGLLMGVGSVGPHLSAYRRSKTYLSRNGGRTWVETRGIETMHEFGDHGGILVTIDNEGPTNELWYSTNHGATWATYQFTDGERLRIEEVSSGITQGGTTFTIVGRRLVSGHHGRFGDVVVVSVDFSKLHKRACQYTESDGDQSDFELWSPGPPNAADQACYNGQQASYWRRKQDAACFVGREFEPPKTVKQTCECTEADFECEAGFWPNDAGKCMLEGPDPYQPKDCLDGTKYIGKSGYKKRPSSVCRGGVDLEHPVERVCGLSGGA
ncbi:vacuolar protein sorting/targeting protein PEP1, partial [Spiromyces aspiralis]